MSREGVEAMKKCVGFVLFILFAFCIQANAGPQSRQSNTVKIFSGNTIYGNSGASIYVLDLKSPNYYEVLGGTFSYQLSGITCAAVDATGGGLYLSGATIEGVTVYQTNTLQGLTNDTTGKGISPGLITNGSIAELSLLRKTVIIPSINIQTGATMFNYGFSPTNRSRYLITEVKSGCTDVVLDMYADMY